MTLRWYGSKYDTVTLKQIRQIPGVTGVISTLYDTAPGEVWSRERIRALKDEVEASGLRLSGIESVNIHDAIKTGVPEREIYIENYIQTLKNLGEEDIHLVCYNFMPVFDWTRTELARVRPDGSTVLAYTQEAVDAITANPEEIAGMSNDDINKKIGEIVIQSLNGVELKPTEPVTIKYTKVDNTWEAASSTSGDIAAALMTN